MKENWNAEDSFDTTDRCIGLRPVGADDACAPTESNAEFEATRSARDTEPRKDDTRAGGRRRAMIPHALRLLLLFCLTLLLWASPGHAALLQWEGGTSTDFFDPSNWNPPSSPTAADTCLIQNFTTYEPAILIDERSCGSLELGTGATPISLTFTGENSLTIAGDVTIGANGSIVPSGTPIGTFTVGGNWSDDLGTANLTGPNLQLRYVFTGTNKTIITDESFHVVDIQGTIALAGDITIDDRLIISSSGTLTQGANTITLDGNTFEISGTYNHTCGSVMEINGTIPMGNGDRYPNVTVNSGGSLTGGNPVYIDCDLTIQSGGTVITGNNMHVGGDWVNNGGTVDAGTGTVHMTGVNKQIRGSASTTFFGLTIGDGSGDSATALLDTTADGDLVVTAGSTFTIQADRDFTANSDTTVDGTMNLNGTSTFAHGGTGIIVGAGGLLSAQGTDSANRVTFTRSGGSFHDLVVNGGVDFNFVNVHYTRSATSAAGFAINSPPAETVALDNVAINFTEDKANAVMMVWNSDRTLAAAGFTFDSATYSSADGDVNVEALQGTINFAGAGGNYSGEALDDDNGGLALWDGAVTSTAAEIAPNTVNAGSTGNSFTYDLLPTIGGLDTGIDRVIINAPGGYSNLSVTAVDVGGSGLSANCPVPAAGQYCATISGQDMTVTLGSKVTVTLTNIRVTFDADAPASLGSGAFLSHVDDTLTPSPPQGTTAGNADGDAGDANSQTVDVLGANITWVGGTSTDFGDAANWFPVLPPDSSRTCTVTGYTTYQPEVLSNESCGSLELGTGATPISLTFTGANSLAITGDVTVGANGSIAPSGTPAGVFTVGGNWSDDLATANFTSPDLHLQYVFTGTNKTISTDESFYDVSISGTIALASDITIGNSLNVNPAGTLTHGANTITLDGNTFNVSGTYDHTCSSLIEINGTIAMGNGDRYPTVTVNSGGSLTGGNPVYIDCDLTVQSGGTVTTGGAMHVGGDWVNNGGTVNPGTGMVHMTGVNKRIRGSASTTFFGLTIGDSSGDSTTALLDTTADGDLVVTAGSTFTIQTDRNFTDNGTTTVDGTLNLSGTSTFTQDGSNTGIIVGAGGLLSAQGTDSANRVTFTRSGASIYDLIINGGIDFNYVNVTYTRSASTPAKGFRINSPGGATVNFNHVAFSDTQDVNNAVMMLWNANRTITATGCSFDSATYTAANGDVNVEALQGTIDFTNYGGNYAGEALDSDNGGVATWSINLDIVKQVWEENGSAPLASPVTAPTGSMLVFLIYVKNLTPGQVTDVRMNDSLDELGFEYVAGSLVRTSAAAPPADTASDLAIFNATDPGTGTGLSDGVDADVSSAQDTGGPADVDRITVGAVTGQANGSLTIDGNTTFAVRFRVKVK